MSELTRATVAMCPKCKRRVEVIPGLKNPSAYKCSHCEWVGIQSHWGYYPPDAVDVVKKLEAERETISKLVQATVPMCPEIGCSGECELDDEGYYVCLKCGWCCGGSQEVPMGVYVPDVTDLVAKMRGRVEACGVVPGSCAFDNATVVTNKELLDWLDQLVGLGKGNEG